MESYRKEDKSSSGISYGIQMSLLRLHRVVKLMTRSRKNAANKQEMNAVPMKSTSKENRADQTRMMRHSHTHEANDLY